MKNIQISEQIIFKSGSHQELDFEDDSAESIQSSFLYSWISLQLASSDSLTFQFQIKGLFICG